MDIEEALIELSFHSGRNSEIKDPRWENGFLGSLRPYRSFELVESNFHKIIECLRAMLLDTEDESLAFESYEEIYKK